MAKDKNTGVVPPDAGGSTPEEPLKVIELERNEEWHVTVAAQSPLEWARFCNEQGRTPLYLELNTLAGSPGQLQLMTTLESQSDFDDFTRVLASHPEFTVLRIKHEVQTLKAGETPLYYEAHVKFDGGYRPDLRGASRDLFRLLPDRWYVTQRRQPFVDPNLFGKVPFSVDAFKESVHLIAEPYVLNRRIDGVEAEWVLTDTNQDLDKGWL